MVEALQSRKAQRLGKVKKLCRKLLTIEAYKNPTARQIITQVVEKSEDYRELAQYFLYNIYYGYKNNPEPADPYYLSVVQNVTKLLTEYSEPDIQGIALGALGNLGSYAVRYASNIRSPNPVLEALGSKHEFLRKCAKFAMECNPPNQPEGKPKLQARELGVVRGQQGVDVPAYQESEHYSLQSFEDDGKEGEKKSKIILPGS